MIIKIIILLVLIFINGLLSASEIAFLSLNKYDLINKRDKKSKRILKTLETEGKFLSTIQIGITIAGFFASAYASDTFTDALMNIGFFIISKNFTEIVLMILITFILSYITLVFGELVPKKIGRSNPKKVSYSCINIISFIGILFYPLVNLLTISTEFVCKILKIKDRDNSLTTKDIKKMIVNGSKEGIVEEKEKEYILNVFDFKDKNANKIMTPRDEVVTININDSKEKIIRIIKRNRFTRFPVLDANNNVIGFLNVKDFIYLHQSHKNFKIKDLIHNVLAFDKRDKIDDIFRIMQENHETFSIIKDKDEFIGILTIEDAVEEIMGNIQDEYN